MKSIDFVKMVASGNDFVVVEVARSQGHKVTRLKEVARKICDRKYGVGADGLLVVEKSKIADIKMRIFNADGSEAEMCGNGARCFALHVHSQLPTPASQLPTPASQLPTPASQLKIETKAGIIEAIVQKDKVRIRLTDAKNIKLDIPIKVNNRMLKLNFVNTGVPHAVVFTEGLEKIDVFNLGRYIRYHKKFAPKGTNANFIEVLGNNSIAIRTYERGVEDETLACGTGSVASALIFSLKSGYQGPVSVLTKGKEILKVYFRKEKNNFYDVWLEGQAKKVFKGKLEKEVVC
jgi:diaminopimelate epimerase